MHRRGGSGPKLQQRVLEQVRHVPRVVDRRGIARQRLHERDVVQRLWARVLKHAQALEDGRHFSAQEKKRRAVGLRGRHRGDGVGQAGAADAERRAKISARPRIAVGHIGGAAFLRGDNRRERFLPAQRREKGIDEAAGHHEQMVESFARQRFEDKIDPQRH
jgi:hypothetical protein